jgi:hypothetical protein
MIEFRSRREFGLAGKMSAVGGAGRDHHRQRPANRANAAKSTGPRTKAGKAKASQNARWHGLAAALSSEPGAV